MLSINRTVKTNPDEVLYELPRKEVESRFLFYKYKRIKKESIIFLLKRK